MNRDSEADDAQLAESRQAFFMPMQCYLCVRNKTRIADRSDQWHCIDFFFATR